MRALTKGCGCGGMDGPTSSSGRRLLQRAGAGVQQAHSSRRVRARGARQGDPDPPAQEPAGGSERRRHGQLQERGKREQGRLGPAENRARAAFPLHV